MTLVKFAFKVAAQSASLLIEGANLYFNLLLTPMLVAIETTVNGHPLHFNYIKL